MTNLIWLLLVLENVLSVVLLVYSALKLDGRTALKSIFIALLLFNLLWTNGVLIVRLPGVSMQVAALISKLIFFTSISMLIMFGLFVYYFIRSITGRTSTGWRNILFWLFQFNSLFLLVNVFTGLIEQGVRPSEIGYSPIYGILHKYMVFSMLAFGAYFFYLLFAAYRHSETEQQGFQLSRVFRYSGIAFSIMIVTNGLVPALLNNSGYSILGTMALMVLYTGLLVLLLKGYTLLLTSQFRALLRAGIAHNERNILALRQFIELLRFLLRDSPRKFRRHLEFVTEGEQLLQVVVQHAEDKGLIKKEQLAGQLSAKWVRGVLDTLLLQERENRHLVFSLIRAEQLLNDTTLRKLVAELPAETPRLSRKSYPVADYRESIEANLRQNREALGVEMLCFAPAGRKALERVRAAAPSSQTVIFSGESGSGRSLLATAMHNLRGGGKLHTVSCHGISEEELRNGIQAFLEQQADKPGLVIRHLEALDRSQTGLLEPLLRDFAGRRFVYFTCEPVFLARADRLSTDIRYRLLQMVIETSPLRKRKDDIFYLVLYFMDKHAKQLGRDYRAVAKACMDQATRATWPGNVTELKTSIRNSLLENRPPELIRLQAADSSALLTQLDEGNEKYTPLENAERKVIEKYLILNSYHLTATCKQLGITINTLKARIRKYGILYPGAKA